MMSFHLSLITYLHPQDLDYTTLMRKIADYIFMNYQAKLQNASKSEMQTNYQQTLHPFKLKTRSSSLEEKRKIVTLDAFIRMIRLLLMNKPMKFYLRHRWGTLDQVIKWHTCIESLISKQKTISMPSVANIQMRLARSVKSMTFQRINGLRLEIWIKLDITIQWLYLKIDICMWLAGEIAWLKIP